MPDVLVDTDVFVDHLRGARRLRLGQDRICYSIVTRAELYAGRETEEDRVGRLLAPFRELTITREIAERAGRLRRGARTTMADALIAATALEHGLRLRTRNIRHFEAIDGLSLAPDEVDAAIDEAGTD